MKKLFVTFFGIGLIPWAPGTFGSIGGAVVAWAVLLFFPQTTLLLLGILLFLFSIKIIDAYERDTKTHDSSHIVIDEVAGVFIAISIGGIGLEVAKTGANSGDVAGDISYLCLILALVFFRIFDIWKPSIIGRIDRSVRGGLGVMLDDMIAGAIAGICVLGVIGAMMKFGLAEFIF